VTDDLNERAREAVRQIVLALRNARQDGYYGFDEQEGWLRSRALSYEAPPELLAVLFEFAGVQPEAIAPLGRCADCKHRDVRNDVDRPATVPDEPSVQAHRYHRGWSRPCEGCAAPKLDKFEADDGTALLNQRRYRLARHIARLRGHGLEVLFLGGPADERRDMAVFAPPCAGAGGGRTRIAVSGSVIEEKLVRRRWLTNSQRPLADAEKHYALGADA